MGNLLLLRILKYLNGTLFFDDYYHFCIFFVENYEEFYKLSLDEIAQQSHVSQEAIMHFISYLGYQDFDAFQARLYQEVMLRMDQVRARMIGLDIEGLVERIGLCQDKQEFIESLEQICQDIYACRRVILIGALYPMSIAVEFQTDLITFGKPVLQYHAFDTNLTFEDGDYVIFISATGRAVKSYLYDRKLDIERANSLLITQNKVYVNKPITKRTLQVPGKFDSIHFNYQLMTIFDLIRVIYYQNYHFI